MTGKIWLGPLFVLCFGLLLLRQGVIGWWEDRKIAAGVRLEAQVVSDGPAQDDPDERRLSFRYQPPQLDGAAIVKEERLSKRSYRTLVEQGVLRDGRVVIRCARDQPERFRFDNYRSRAFAAVGVGLLCSLLGGGIFAFRWRRIYGSAARDLY